jgi:hypothetical protein
MKEPVSSFEEDRQLIVDLFLEVIAMKKLYEFLEDDQLTWIDDTIGKHAYHEAVKSDEAYHG